MTPIHVCGDLWAAWFLYWMIAARSAKKTVESESRFSRLLHLVPLCIAFAAIFTSSLDYGILRLSLSFISSGLRELGIALTVAGLGFSIWARIHLGKNWSGTM